MASLDRYQLPTWEELNKDRDPETGACWNCGHAAEVTIGGKTYALCCIGRDTHTDAEVFLCDPNTRECPDWKEEW